MDKVLIIDDEIELCNIIKDCLELENIEGICCYDGEEALPFFLKHKPQVVVLDIMLPKVNGMELCKQIRNISKVPIIMLSARFSDTDKVLALGFGADDYVTKPFSTTELNARIKAQIRRFKMQEETLDGDIISLENLYIDRKRYLVKVKDRKVELSAKELEILYLLTKNKGQVFTKEAILEKVWGFNDYGDINTVSVHIRKLREKIEENPSKPELITTVWSVGYKFNYEEK